jgi:hypothetical protein
MARAAHGIDYEADLATIRANYVSATPRQRLAVIRQRLQDHHFGPNRLVTAVSAVEALARSLAMHTEVRRKSELAAVYPRYSHRKPERLIREYLQSKGVPDPETFFAEDTWELFGYAVSYRNLLAHECTYLGLEKFPSLIAACEDILSALVKLGRVPEPRA